MSSLNKEEENEDWASDFDLNKPLFTIKLKEADKKLNTSNTLFVDEANDEGGHWDNDFMNDTENEKKMEDFVVVVSYKIISLVLVVVVVVDTTKVILFIFYF